MTFRFLYVNIKVFKTRSDFNVSDQNTFTMKKYVLIIAILLSGIGVASAQKISGNWLITKVNVDGKEQGVYTRIDFLENGDMEVSGRNMGTWTYNQKKKVINIVSAKFKELNGTSEVKEINESELIIENNGARIFFVKLDKQKITNDNLASGLIGTWQIVDDNNPDVTKLITFKAPDIVTTVEWEPGMESTSEGTWIFDPRKMSLLIMGRLSDFGGENKVVSIGETELELINNNNHFIAKRRDQKTSGIEHLKFTEADFYDQEGDYRYEDDEQKLPWQDPYKMMASLAGVQHLVYTHSTLIEETGVFNSKKLTADVSVDEAGEMLNIDFIFYGYDQYNLPEDTELPPNQINPFQCTNKLYPQQDIAFRVIGNEQLVTPAGTFDCTVIEGVDNFEVRKKCWLVNDRPGIYAKIIEDKSGDFGHYIIYELQEM